MKESWNPAAGYPPYGSTEREGHLEIVPSVLFDTSTYISGITYSINFFSKIRTTFNESNMYYPNVLPAQQSFLIQSMRIHGVTSALKFGLCRLDIGPKIYHYVPAWMYSLKEKGWKLHPPLVIPAQTQFRFQVSWAEPVKLGKGFMGDEIQSLSIQVLLIGKLARPIQ